MIWTVVVFHNDRTILMFVAMSIHTVTTAALTRKSHRPVCEFHRPPWKEAGYIGLRIDVEFQPGPTHRTEQPVPQLLDWGEIRTTTASFSATKRRTIRARRKPLFRPSFNHDMFDLEPDFQPEVCCDVVTFKTKSKATHRWTHLELDRLRIQRGPTRISYTMQAAMKTSSVDQPLPTRQVLIVGRLISNAIRTWKHRKRWTTIQTKWQTLVPLSRNNQDKIDQVHRTSIRVRWNHRRCRSIWPTWRWASAHLYQIDSLYQNRNRPQYRCNDRYPLPVCGA